MRGSSATLAAAALSADDDVDLAEDGVGGLTRSPSWSSNMSAPEERCSSWTFCSAAGSRLRSTGEKVLFPAANVCHAGANINPAAIATKRSFNLEARCTAVILSKTRAITTGSTDSRKRVTNSVIEIREPHPCKCNCRSCPRASPLGVVPAQIRFMDEGQSDYQAIHAAAAKFEMIHGLKRALDVNYRRLARAAQAQWNSRFAGQDASDACVSVRITAAEAETQPTRGSGFLPPRKSSEQKAKRKLSLPTFAR